MISDIIKIISCFYAHLVFNIIFNINYIINVKRKTAIFEKKKK